MGYLEQIGACPSKRGLKKLLLFDGMYRHLELQALTYTATEKLREEGRLDSESSALNYILCHPWHSRIWTVQEATYAQDCQVVCGNSSIPWEIYSAAAHFLVFEQFIDQLDPQAHKSLIGIDIRNTIREYLREVPSSKSSLSQEDEDNEQDRRVVFLSSCLSDVNQLQATEPRDKIYGLYALYNDLGIPLPAVDYKKSVSCVYEEAAVAMITWSGTLKVLGDACRYHRDTSFPSWVPNWSDEDIKIFTPSGDATGGSKITHPSPKSLNPQRGELHVQGKVVGKVIAWRNKRSIAAIFPTRPEQCELPILMEKLDGLLEDVETMRLWIDKTRFFRRLHNLLRTNADYCDGDPEDMLIDLLYQDSYSEPDENFRIWLDILQYPETEYDLTFGELLVEKWKTAKESTASSWTEDLTNCAVIMASLLSNTIQHASRMSNHTSGILDLINQFSANLADKTLMLTYINSISKTALGTSFHSAATGDSVVLLEGADYPIVLRETGTKWRFIGPAFVTGIMDGEAWSDESGQVDDIRHFTLV
jgi:hypothetical protein